MITFARVVLLSPWTYVAYIVFSVVLIGLYPDLATPLAATALFGATFTLVVVMSIRQTTTAQGTASWRRGLTPLGYLVVLGVGMSIGLAILFAYGPVGAPLGAVATIVSGKLVLVAGLRRLVVGPLSLWEATLLMSSLAAICGSVLAVYAVVFRMSA
jgi:hypothetical protein